MLKTPGLCILLLILSACDSTEPTEPTLAAPGNLRAAADSGAVVVAWTPSTSAAQPNFAGYRIIINDPGAATPRQHDTGKDSTFRIAGLTNGVMYQISVQALSTSGKTSPDQATITWSPAERITRDLAGQPLRVYAVTSKNGPCAVDLSNNEGKAELLYLASEDFKQRATFYVHTLGTSSGVIIRSPHLAFVPGPQRWFAAGTAAEANTLTEHLATAPQDTGAYTASYITVPNGTYTKGRIYFGRLPHAGGDLYYRMLLKRTPTGRLVHGTGDERYLEIEVSMQRSAGNRFAKQ